MVTLWSVVPRFHPSAHEDCISLYVLNLSLDIYF